MDDIAIAEELLKLQKEVLCDQDVVHYMTKMNHLELRVKNVALTKLFQLKQQASKDTLKTNLSALILEVTDKNNSKNKLNRMNTAVLKSDGLLSRLSDKIDDTQRRITQQDNTIKKIQQNITLLMPVSQRHQYVVDDDTPRITINPDSNIKLNN